MSATRLAHAIGALAVMLILTGPALQVVANANAILFSLSFAAVQLSSAAVGTIVASRVPHNPVGWILLMIGTGLGLSVTLGTYGELGVRHATGGLPGDEIAAWLGEWTFVPFVFGGIVALLHVFPDGRFMSRRWKIVCFLSIGVVLVAAGLDALAPGRLENLSSIDNPLGATGAFADLVVTARAVIDPLALPVFGSAVLVLVLRLRSSRGAERQQIKWIVYALTLVAIGLTISAAGPEDADTPFLLAMLALAAMPVAAGVAVMRYRLYDIDVVINRTLVYGALTATLAGFYLGCVLLLQLGLSGVTDGSSLSVALSTLAVAALARPVRARIQRVVDRRFFRRKYDAARTLETFGLRLRDEVDLDTLGRDLVDVVNETMQPRHASLWLRGS